MNHLRCRRHSVACALLATVLAGIAWAGETTAQVIQPAGFRIIADPDVRVSFDGSAVHMEAYIAASVTDPDRLFAFSEILFPGRPLQAAEGRIYFSETAGATWKNVLLPAEINGGWDNAVAAGFGGMLYALTSNLERGLTLYRSGDGGITWTSSVIAGTMQWDRPYLAVDCTGGAYSGRVYVVAEAPAGVAIVISADQGITFGRPSIACPRIGELNVAVSSAPMILHDGGLMLPCAPYPNFPARAKWDRAETGLVISSNGGQHFSSYSPVLTLQRPLPGEYYPARARADVLLSGNFMPGPVFAVAPPSSPFPDRVFAAWQNTEAGGNSRILFSRSTDGGRTWSDPRTVDDLPAKVQHSRQGVPMLAVDARGVVGLAWFDGRHNPDHRGYDVYFTASADGGETFSPPVRVSSASSRPAVKGQNTLPAFQVGDRSSAGEGLVTMTSPFSTRSTGADYASMTVDAAGRFHVLWPDARNGLAWQLYTSTVRVTAGSGQPRTARLQPDVNLVFGEPRWVKGREIIVPLRLLNTSRDTITGPVEVSLSEAALPGKRAKIYVPAVPLPVFYDERKRRYADSVRVVYPASPQRPIFPNGVSPELEIRLRLDASEWVDFTFRTKIGKVTQK